MTALPDNATTPPPLNFQWVPQPEAQKLVDELLEGFLGACPAAACMAGRMLDEAGTRFKDWVDFIEVPATDELCARLASVGCTPIERPGALYEHQAGFIRESDTIGLHLENLERNDEFKGFNQQGVGDIIQRTDARKHIHPTGA